jgi:hypothetical protein
MSALALFVEGNFLSLFFIFIFVGRQVGGRETLEVRMRLLLLLER